MAYQTPAKAGRKRLVVAKEAPKRASERTTGAKSPTYRLRAGNSNVKRPDPPAPKAAPKPSVTGRKPSMPAAKSGAASLAEARLKSGAMSKGDNTRTTGSSADAGSKLPGGIDRPTDPSRTQPVAKTRPAPTIKSAGTPQPKRSGTPPVPASKPGAVAGSTGSTGSSAVPNYAVKAIQARSGPGRGPSGAVTPPKVSSVGFTRADATGGFGAKARPANYSYMDREK